MSRDFHENHRRMMNGFYGSPFSSSPFMAITDGNTRLHQQDIERRRHRQPQHYDPFAMSPFGGFGMMDSMFRSMEENFERMANDPNSHSYTHSSVMSFSNTGTGAPQFYEATTTSKAAPGGVREERKTVKDSTTGTQKMSITHKIGDREHKIEKSKDVHTGQIEENQEFVNMDETDAARFDHEFQQRTSRSNRHRGIGSYPENRRHTPAITEGPSYRDREEDPPRPRHPSRGRRPKKSDLYDI
ncbi:Myeloid leukemia factor 2 [Holothuria leucospilota]|uniref:Myeloid leukemia factor 2 n=1 Tax=Holothuria leucospilota TaxID=206669 RepID=A0A9Q0YMR0_HOLLE|nr:Myeloid leukemia factor 2 [Holothuria leucospilota]